MFLIGHGISVRTDLPVPEWLFWWAAAIVLVVSFVALATLWPEPRLQQPRWRPLPGGIGRVLASRPVEIACGAVGVFLLALTVYAGLEGTESTSANWAPIFIYVIFWLAFVPLSLLFGDVFRAFNPWRAIGRAVAWIARTVSRSELPEPLAYPDWLGRWPAAVGIFGFAAMELVVSDGDKPSTLAVATLAYSAVTFVGMALYGVERWCDRGEAFSVYFNLFSRLSIFEKRDREVGVRPFLSGLAQLEQLRGTVPLLTVMIGTVSFDGFSSKRTWNSRSPDISQFFQDLLGLTPEHALELTFLVGMLGSVLLIVGLLLARHPGREERGRRLQRIAAGERVRAHAGRRSRWRTWRPTTSRCCSTRARRSSTWRPIRSATAPNIFGTAGHQVKYGLIGSNVEWYVKVGFIVAGHVAALILAHDRALAIYRDARQAVRSQYWMLGVMLGFTLLAVWLVSEANT